MVVLHRSKMRSQAISTNHQSCKRVHFQTTRKRSNMGIFFSFFNLNHGTLRRFAGSLACLRLTRFCRRSCSQSTVTSMRAAKSISYLPCSRFVWFPSFLPAAPKYAVERYLLTPHHEVRSVCPIRHDTRILVSPPREHPCLPYDDHLHPPWSWAELLEGCAREANQQPHRA